MNVYIRFGRWSARSTNHGTDRTEKGVSVYRARERDGIATLLDEPSEQLDGQGRLVFAVTGQEVGIGSDGEPLLRRVRATRHAIDLASIPQRVRK